MAVLWLFNFKINYPVGHVALMTQMTTEDGSTGADRLQGLLLPPKKK